MMSTFANRPNNSATAPMSESDNDDDNEQNSSFNQQNEVYLKQLLLKICLFLLIYRV